jgi:Protein of unknown function (DUF1553)/Protein of unknown function (DUF1549)/Planctomycete cytochrome C
MSFAKTLYQLSFVSAFALAIAVNHVSADTGTRPKPEDIEFFEKQVRPLLADQCLGCHGGAASAANGGLRIASQADLIKGGYRGAAIVPGHPESSLLIKAVTYTEHGLSMPPRARLTDAQIAVLSDWVKRGAPWPAAKSSATAPGAKAAFNLTARKSAHWAWKPVVRPAVPTPGLKSWVRTPIDSFILAELEAKKLAPAPFADRRTLIRRATFDLTGLPPTRQEIADFLNDKAPNAYEKVVDRLLASPHYGERWARHWLDLVRFAETDGHEFDLEKPGAYQYRDYLVRAFNADVPYRQFAMEHIAGDLMPSPRKNPDKGFNESVLGTGFYWLGSGTHSPVDLLDDQADHMDNEIDTLGKTFLALGLGCARCHDHKFDAISSKDYYGLYGILRSTRKQFAKVGAPTAPTVLSELDTVRTAERNSLLEWAHQSLAKPSGIFAPEWAPALAADKGDAAAFGYAAARLKDVPADRFVAELYAVRAQLKDQQTRAQTSAKTVTWYGTQEGIDSRLPLWSSQGEAFGSEKTPAISLRFSGGPHPQVTSAVWASSGDSGRLSEKLHGTLQSQTFTITKPRIIYRLAGHSTRVRLIVDGLQILRDPLYGGLNVGADSDALRWQVQDVSRWIGHRAYVELQDIDPGSIALDRVGFTAGEPPADAPDQDLMDGLMDPALKDKEGVAAVYARLAQSASRGQGAFAAWEAKWTPLTDTQKSEIATLEARRTAAEAKIDEGALALCAEDGTGENEKLHLRGNYRTLGTLAPRRFLEAIDGKQDFGTAAGCGRWELASHLASANNPLFARVMVNRIWQHHFGDGIVRTPDDFGVMGQRPTNQPLLDWLASEFVRQGWSIKKMHRLMLLSNTYRMDSRGSAAAEAADPQNKLVHRMPVLRLEAESIRDSILAVSGRLDPTIGGPSVMPYLTSFTVGRGAPPSGPLDGAGRRSLYISVRRGFPVPMLSAFDMPVPASTMGRRTVSSVPAQALTLLNDPFVVSMAGVWAKQLLKMEGSPETRITAAYETAFGRLPDGKELQTALTFVKGSQPGSPAELEAWTGLCHVLFNVKEFIFIR